MAVALLALFIALGGSSYAAVKLAKNSVRSEHIAGNAVASQEVKDGSLMPKDFKRPPAGLAGPAGAAGPQGPTGLTGSRGPSDAYTAFFGDRDIPAAAGPGVLLGELDLAAGDYLVFANAAVLNHGIGDRHYSCVLIEASVTPTDAADTAQLTVPEGAHHALALTGAFSLPSDATVHFICVQGGSTSGTGSTFKDIDVGAIRVAALH